MTFNRVCISEALYPIMFYLLISDEKEIDDTYFIVDNRIDEGIRNRLENVYCENLSTIFRKRDFLLNLYGLWLRKIKLRFLKDAEFFGLDFKWHILRGHKLNYIEDCPNVFNLWETGFLYRLFVKHSKQSAIKKKLLELVYGDYYQHPVGTSKSIKTLNTTGVYQKPYHFGKKELCYDLGEEWQKSSSKKKEKILKIFDITPHDLDEFKRRNIILLTQAFSNDGYVTEEEQIEIYRKILSKYDCNKVILKPHPRDRINYSILFPKVHVFRKVVPLQLLAIMGVRVDRVVTVTSSSALSFGDGPQIDWYGANVHPKILAGEGDRTLDDSLRNYREQQKKN